MSQVTPGEVPQATIGVGRNELGQVMVSLEFAPPDGKFGIDLELAQASYFCYALHAACRDGLAMNGGSMGSIEGFRTEHYVGDEIAGVTFGTSND